VSSLGNSIKFPRLIYLPIDIFPLSAPRKHVACSLLPFMIPFYYHVHTLFICFTGSQLLLWDSTIWLWLYSYYYISTVLVILHNFWARRLTFICTKRTAALFLLGVNISYGIPCLVFCEGLLYILIHFSLTKNCFHSIRLSATAVFQQIVDWVAVSHSH
jgi:hypothetical protein